MRAGESIGRRGVVAAATGAMLLGRAGKAAADISPLQDLTALHQAQLFDATPAQLYRIFVTTRQFEDATGLPAAIDPRPGGHCTLLGGQVQAFNLELLPDARLVQAWRSSLWSPGVYSIVRFEFHPQAAKTRLVLDQTAIPAGQFGWTNVGWTFHYWGPLREYLAP